MAIESMSVGREGIQQKHIAKDLDRSASSKRERGQRLERLKERDNVTNLGYLAYVYLVILAAVGLTVWSYYALPQAGFSLWWSVPITIVAVIVIGAAQHQLGGVIHEGTHYILFANRNFNELASDWLAAFPIYTSTYAFRLHHLAHHQFVNDPVRDPNFDQAKDSGHWLDFPVAHVELLWAILKTLWPPHLIAYIAARARYSAIGVDTNPYADKSKAGSPWTIRSAVLYAILVPFVSVALVELGQPVAAVVSVIASALAVIVYLALAPDSAFSKSKIDPVISHRTTAISRVVYVAVLYLALTLINISTGEPAWGYYTLLWVLPLFTSFPLFMILREWVQHGNADRGRYTNTRIFLVKNPFVRFAIFPWGMDYHLPHHLFASVPHYKLKALHEFLLDDPKYAEKGLIVEGWSKPQENNHPTIIDVLGPDYAPTGTEKAHVDDTTLENADVNDTVGIAREIRESRKSSKEAG